MNFYLARISYNGSAYKGWQIQPNVRTIQGELNKALKSTFVGREIETLGASRTDAGVHALDQVVRIKIDLDLPSEKILWALNKALPDDICIKSIQPVDNKFHPLRDVKYKRYHYFFTNSKVIDPFVGQHITPVQFTIDKTTAQRVCDLFTGTKSFHNYYCVGSEHLDYIRTVKSCFMEEVHFKNVLLQSQTFYRVNILGSGFLKQMVRLMMGALFGVMRNQLTCRDIEKSFELDYHKRIAPVAPAKGLILAESFLNI